MSDKPEGTEESNETTASHLEGTPKKTDLSIAKVTYMSLERGTIIRYLEPGDAINLPADRVEVEALEEDE